MKEYNTFNEIDTDLRRLDLERKIAIEELKLIKGKVEKDLEPVNLIISILKIIAKVGFFKLLKKTLK